MSLPLSKHQSRLGLGIVVAGGRAADEHGGATVSTEGVLQDAGHFAVTVRHMSFLKEDGEKRGGRGGGGDDEKRRLAKRSKRERKKIKI